MLNRCILTSHTDPPCRLQEEKAQWDSMLSGLSSTVSKEIAADEPSAASSSAPNAALLDSRDATLLHSLARQDDLITATISRFQNSTQGLELQVDNLAEGVHKMQKLAEAVDEVADRVQNQAAAALERRDQEALQRTGAEKVDVRDILRSLVRTG